jgi:hypothetical protein
MDSSSVSLPPSIQIFTFELSFKTKSFPPRIDDNTAKLSHSPRARKMRRRRVVVQLEVERERGSDSPPRRRVLAEQAQRKAFNSAASSLRSPLCVCGGEVRVSLLFNSKSTFCPALKSLDTSLQQA